MFICKVCKGLVKPALLTAGSTSSTGTSSGISRAGGDDSNGATDFGDGGSDFGDEGRLGAGKGKLLASLAQVCHKTLFSNMQIPA
jgi:hypothetical protein